MKTINESNIKEILGAPAAVLDFWATWCGPCRMLSPVVEKLSEEYAGKVEFGSINVDEEESLAVSYGISVIPTLLFMKNGNVVNKTVGVRSADELKSIIEERIK